MFFPRALIVCRPITIHRHLPEASLSFNLTLVVYIDSKNKRRKIINNHSNNIITMMVVIISHIYCVV